MSHDFTSLHFLRLIPGRGWRSGSVVSKSFCRLHLLAPPAVPACPGSQDRAISLWVCPLVAFRGSPCPSLVWGCFLVPYGAHAQTIWACSPFALLFILPTPSSFLISSLFILSFTVTPLILLSILISVFSRIFSSFTPVVQHSAPYKMTGLTTVVYSLVFNFVGIFLSSITGPSSLHFCYPALTLALSAVSDPPSSQVDKNWTFYAQNNNEKRADRDFGYILCLLRQQCARSCVDKKQTKNTQW